MTVGKNLSEPIENSCAHRAPVPTLVPEYVIILWGVCKTWTRYLRMADADGKMRIENIADHDKNTKKSQIH